MLRKSVGALSLTAALCASATARVESQHDVRTYVVDPASSTFNVKVGRAGFLKVFGHDHTIAVERYTGSIEWNENDPTQSRFTVEVEAASLIVADEELSEKDRASVQSDMESKALGLPEFQQIRFDSSEIRVRDDGEPMKIDITGTLDLRGFKKDLRIPAELNLSNSAAQVSGEFKINGEDFGVPQISAVGGAVKTKHELEFSFEMQATLEPER